MNVVDIDAEIERLEAEKRAGMEFVEERKPYWMSLRHPRGEEMRWDLFNYFPAGHYDRRIADLEGEGAADRLRPDGGRYTDTLYAWYDADTDTYLTHVEMGDEFATPFFGDEEAARRYLDHRAREVDDTARFEGLSLQKLRAKKIGEAVEVLTDQAGIEDFIPDGGQQIDGSAEEEVWFWYDPAADMILQREVEPYNVVGLFETEEDADWFIRAYADWYGLEDVGHIEKYRADLEFVERGPVLDTEESERSEGESVQAEFDDLDIDTFADKHPELKHLDPDEWNDDDAGDA